MEKFTKSNDYFYRGDNTLCAKWSFIKKEKSSNHLTIFISIALILLFIGAFL